MIFIDILTKYWEAFAALGGIALFIPAVVNVLKKLGIVGEGEGDSVQGIIQMVLFLFFVGLRIFLPNFDVDVADSVMEQIAGVIVFLLSFLGQFGITRVAYTKFWKGRMGALGYFHS